MPKIHASTSVGATPAYVFGYVADFRHATSLVSGLSRFEPVDENTSGEGARFAATFDVGPKSYDATLEVSIFEPERRIGWTSVTGAGQSLVFSFQPAAGGTAVDFELGFDLPSGITGNILGLTVEPLLRARARETADTLKTLVEDSARQSSEPPTN